MIVVSRWNSRWLPEPKKRRECLTDEIGTNVLLQLETCTTLQRRRVQTAISANCICHQVLPVARTRAWQRMYVACTYARTSRNVRIEYEKNYIKRSRTGDRIAERFGQCRPESIRNQWTRCRDSNETDIVNFMTRCKYIRINRFCSLAFGVFPFVVTTRTVTVSVFTSSQSAANARRRVKANLARREYFYYRVKSFRACVIIYLPWRMEPRRKYLTMTMIKYQTSRRKEWNANNHAAAGGCFKFNEDVQKKKKKKRKPFLSARYFLEHATQHCTRDYHEAFQCSFNTPDARSHCKTRIFFIRVHTCGSVIKKAEPRLKIVLHTKCFEGHFILDVSNVSSCYPRSVQFIPLRENPRFFRFVVVVICLS